LKDFPALQRSLKIIWRRSWTHPANERLCWVQSNLMILRLFIKTKLKSPKMETERALRKLWNTMWKHWRNRRLKTKTHFAQDKKTKKAGSREDLYSQEEPNLLKNYTLICNKTNQEVLWTRKEERLTKNWRPTEGNDCKFWTTIN